MKLVRLIGDGHTGMDLTHQHGKGKHAVPVNFYRFEEGLFITRETLDRRWTSGWPVAIVSDSQRRRDTPDGLVAPPFHVLDRFGDRWILTNFPVSSAH